jgi:hypothetical protein
VKTTLIITIIGTFIAAIPASAGSKMLDSTARFEAQHATAQLSTANTPADFESAAQTLQTMIDSGIRNAPLFYNYGIALLMAEHPKQAIQAFTRAERYSGTTWDIRHNMLVATAKQQATQSTPHLPWYRIPLFWHYGLSARTRLTIACIAFSIIWLIPIARTTKFKETATIIFGSAIIIFILFGSSSATTIYQELHPHTFIPDIPDNNSPNSLTPTNDNKNND